MNFSSGASKPKSWKEIWGSGQGISVVKSILPASELIKRINNEYLEAKKNLL
jgi:nitronate monooxygenase